MSNLFFSRATPPAVESVADGLCFTAKAWKRVTSLEDRLHVASTRVDDVGLWGPGYDKASGVRIWIGGRVAFEESEWARSESLPYEGGLASRLLIDLWHRHGESLPKHVNGAFAIVVHDERKHGLHVFTDAMGMYPLYFAENHPLTWCSHPDVLADYLKQEGLSCELDKLTIAQQIAVGRSMQPSTYYREIKQAEPAAHYYFELSGLSHEPKCTTWWQPAYLQQELNHNADEMAEELGLALRNAASRRTLHRLGNPVVFLSGGADSRAALFGANDPSRVTAFTLCDTINPEIQTAQRLAKLAKAKHVIHKRDLDFYPRGATEAMRIAGGMWNLIDAHYTEAAGPIDDLNPGSILTGCYADYMFKGMCFNRRHRTLFGRNLPLFDAGKFNHQYYHQHYKLKPDWQVQVQAELDSRIPSHLQENYQDNLLSVEDLRIRPLSREFDVAGRLWLWRTQPWDPFMMDRDILAVYERMAPELKMNGIVFGKAVGRVIGAQGRSIPNNNYGTPVHASETQRAVCFLKAVALRKLKRFSKQVSNGPGYATPGSWPDHSYVIAHSPVVRELWEYSKNHDKDLLQEFMGSDPFSVSLEDWAQRDSITFMRILSLTLWLRGRRT